MSNLHHLQKFSRSAALVSHAHAQELVALASSPARNQENTSLSAEQFAISYGVQAEKGKPFPFAGGIAVIPVYGALLHRDPWCDSYATGYDFIGSRFAAALGDEDVKGIVFDLNSYGGHVAGNFELCDQIYAARGQKPMMSLVDSRALSGGYSIASATGRIIATPSADIGSIGVVMMHMSMEQALKNYGVEVTFIFAGKHKVDGNPFQNLPDDVKAALQASVEKSYNQFVSLVARNRGMQSEAVRDTEARVYDAEEAKQIGLIDDVMAPRAAFTSFLSEVSTASTQTKEAINMTTQVPASNAAAGAGATVDTPPTAPAAAAPAAPAAAAPAAPADNASAIAEAQAASKARIKGIMSCDEAKDRPALASHLALDTEMSVEDARKTLAVAQPEVKAAGKGPLAEAMDASGGAGVGADDGANGGDGGRTMSAGERIARNAAKVTGRPLRILK